MSKMMANVSFRHKYCILATNLSQAFKKRVVELVDQAQHFAALGAGGSGGSSSDGSTQTFRQGLDITERESKLLAPFPRSLNQLAVHSLLNCTGKWKTDEGLV